MRATRRCRAALILVKLTDRFLCIRSQMRKIRDTSEVRAILGQWAEDLQHPHAMRAQEAYVSTEPDEDGAFVITVHPELLAELRRQVEIEELPN
jgi:hypothetical protein